MPNTAILFGRLLILLGIIGYGYIVYAMPDKASLTALIPAIFGLVLMVLGHLSNAKENLRKHLMHVAVLVGLLGFLATASSFLKLPALFAGTSERPVAVISQVVMSIICLLFVALSVKSFIDARRSGVV